MCVAAAQILEGVIKYRWNALPADQREGMKNYIASVVIKARARQLPPSAPGPVALTPRFTLCTPAAWLQMSADEAVFRRERAYITKLNAILVAVLKQEWPHRWPTFITDLVAAAKTSETLCENCMVILKARAHGAALLCSSLRPSRC